MMSEDSRLQSGFKPLFAHTASGCFFLCFLSSYSRILPCFFAATHSTISLLFCLFNPAWFHQYFLWHLCYVIWIWFFNYYNNNQLKNSAGMKNVAFVYFIYVFPTVALKPFYKKFWMFNQNDHWNIFVPDFNLYKTQGCNASYKHLIYRLTF